MRFRACIALLLYVSACATSASGPQEPVDPEPRLANLQRAATLPWTDGGRCAVQEASAPWPELAERCFHALDHDRVEFHDLTGRCAVASAGAAALGVGVCVLAVLACRCPYDRTTRAGCVGSAHGADLFNSAECDDDSFL